MKKLLSFVLMMALVLGLSACGGNKEYYEENDVVVYFVPSRPADEILTMTEPLAELLKAEMAELGYDVQGFEVLVSSSYEAAGEALIAGTGDIAFLPGGTYVAYKDLDDSPLAVMLASTRSGLSKDSLNAKDWNDGLETTEVTDQVTYYKGLIIAGPSTAGRAVADKVNAGTALVWDDVKDLNWCVRSSTSSSGYVYPAIWLKENFNKTFDDIEGTVVSTSSYGDSASSIAAGTCDVATFYADARMHNASKWTNEFSRTKTIWEETDVIGVTSNIMNDTITGSTVNLDQDFLDALSQAFINIAKTDEGKAVFDVYSHDGYMVVVDSDYDGARAAAELAGE